MPPTAAPQWEPIELTFAAQNDHSAPYLDVEFWVTFHHESGLELRRPGFWDGDATFKVRFASPEQSGTWTWQSGSSLSDPGLAGQSGELTATANPGNNAFARHGYWHIPTGSRQIQHADGHPAFMVADTPWAIPWRATHDEVRDYARDRQAKGFNAALLMSVMPDQDARGPEDRSARQGFARGFRDLPNGELKQIDPTYFQYLDTSVEILLSHGIAPVWQPVFHGFGWKGLRTAGRDVPPADYARYCRYLVARYGAQPAIWLVLGDGSGQEATIAAGGEEIERCDAYRHPCGLHYAPHRLPNSNQSESWVHFQWLQTGHNGEHRQDRLAAMWFDTPIKAIANGEPTYENMLQLGNGGGWWQGHEAWSNLCAGGVMGVVYGAGSLWQWIHPGEDDHAAWARAPGKSWRDALAFPGSHYVGLMGKILADLPLAGLAPDTTCTYGRRAVFAPDQLLIVYLADGGKVEVIRDDVPDRYRIYDLTTGEIIARGSVSADGPLIADTGDGPRAVIYSASY